VRLALVAVHGVGFNAVGESSGICRVEVTISVSLSNGIGHNIVCGDATVGVWYCWGGAVWSVTMETTGCYNRAWGNVFAWNVTMETAGGYNRACGAVFSWNVGMDIAVGCYSVWGVAVGCYSIWDGVGMETVDGAVVRVGIVFGVGYYSV